ncbi:MAG: DUF2147 domain-containing protein [Bacteroidota bacterium]
MKTPFFYTLLFLGTLFVQAQVSKNDIEGLWLNDDASTVINISEEDGMYYGRIHEILKFPEEDAKDFSAAQLEKGKKKMKGRLILTDLSFKNGEWVNGRILNPKDGSTRAKCTLSLEDDQQLLNIKVKRGLLSATKNWTRYEKSMVTNEN